MGCYGKPVTEMVKGGEERTSLPQILKKEAKSVNGFIRGRKGAGCQRKMDVKGPTKIICNG